MVIGIAEALLFIAAALIVYHHAGYPALLRVWARRRRAAQLQCAAPADTPAAVPQVTLIVPAYNEATVMVAKLANLAALDYPREKLTVVLALDGCTDDTRAVVQASLPRLHGRLDFRLVEYAENIGKVAVLNDQIARAGGDIVALSDASAAVEAQALLRAAAHFADPSVGVVCGGYRLKDAGSEGERAYWAYQTSIKADEAAVAAPMGAHGAFYMFRRALWTPLAPDTINDDFVLPMQIVAGGARSVYDPAITAVELERTRRRQEFRRRVRIGAGNLQQVLRLPELADPRRGALAWVFLSGKGLRPFIPFLALVAVVLLAGLAVAVPGPLFKVPFAVGAALAGAIGFVLSRRDIAVPRPLRWCAYLVEGYMASGLGAMRYLLRARMMGWQPPQHASAATEPRRWSYLTPPVNRAKRALDLTLGLGALLVLAVLVVPIAIAITFESAGPIFYRQRRVGLSTPERTETFELIKFRTMFRDAEAGSGAVWATKNDPRITRVGRLLRKTRLDELPQCLNVLAGDMSIIGPRPERPGFFSQLEEAVPFYTERTYGIRPGITGLAQVNLPYDESIDDVRMKCVYDHAYATRLTTVGEWLRTDLGIIVKTVQVMAMGKGQ